MMRKLILTAVAVVVLSAEAQAQNNSTVTQSGAFNGATVTQSAAGIFATNTSRINQGGVPPFSGAVANSASVSQSGPLAVNSSTINQTSSLFAAFLLFMSPSNTAAVGQSGFMNSVSTTQTQNF